jgi:hypothetical protein
MMKKNSHFFLLVVFLIFGLATCAYVDDSEFCIVRKKLEKSFARMSLLLDKSYKEKLKFLKEYSKVEKIFRSNIIAATTQYKPSIFISYIEEILNNNLELFTFFWAYYCKKNWEFDFKGTWYQKEYSVVIKSLLKYLGRNRSS